MEFFEAVKRGDIAKIEELTIKQPIGKQVHVCSVSMTSRRSPIMVAVMAKNSKVAVRLLEIATEQYTPLPTKKDDKDKNSLVMNNYELANLMQNFQVRFSHPFSLIL